MKPNQPIQSMAAPMTASGMECGRASVFQEVLLGSKPVRGPSTMATISEATPAVVWMTMPPAKSMAPPRLTQSATTGVAGGPSSFISQSPSVASHPPPHTQWPARTR